MRYFIFFYLFTLSNLFGQVGINTVNPDASSMLHIESDNKGILIPRVSLLSMTDTNTITNPAEGLFIYNTSSLNNLYPGLYRYNQAKTIWERLLSTSHTGVMLRTYSADGIGGVGTIFNFPTELFNTIEDVNYLANQLILPKGVYEVESNLRLNSNNTIDFQIRLNGEVIPQIMGSVNPTSFDTNASIVHLVTVFEVDSLTGIIDFEVIKGTGATVLPEQSYIKLKKIF